jgi:coenzyme F420-reducing hydrogenase alpha subunit
MSESRIVKVGALARVEGEGALYVRVEGDRVESVELKIFEPPRFFEAFLRERGALEVPDITARICGICPVAYQMSSVHAVENATGMEIPEEISALRRLLYCGEWIESHALHVLMLHAPDFLGLHSVVELSREFPHLIDRGLQLKKAGNAIVSCVGGREVHPINVRVGGFYRAPRPSELEKLVGPLRDALETARDLARWCSGLDFPEFEPDYEFVSLFHPEEYPMNRGRLISNRGMDIPVEQFPDQFAECQVPHSNALHCRRKVDGSAYQVGPLARFNLAFAQLSPAVRELAEECGLTPPCFNPFKSIIARSLEVAYAIEEALRLIASYRPPERPYQEMPAVAGTGHACTEAPRGILYHRYEVGEDGLIKSAEIVPPTSQNQARMEEDLREMLPSILALNDEDLRRRCEQAIRNYDPCISCATHFLRVELERV